VLDDWQPDTSGLDLLTPASLLARANAVRLGVRDGLAACDLIDAVAESAARLETR
jgi:hypothetical protein